MRDRFWIEPLSLPPGLELVKLRPIVVPRPGPGGASVYDLVELHAPAGVIDLLMAFRAHLYARDVAKLKRRLTAAIEELRQRDLALRRRRPLRTLPAIVTDVASPSAIDACEREEVALIDRKGTLLIHSGPVYVHVLGRRAVSSPSRVRLFRGKACRIVRFLLVSAPKERLRPRRSVQAVASETDTSYSYAHGVLTKLEKEGYIRRDRPHSGFYLQDAVGLLRAWMESGERTAVAVEPFYAPSTKFSTLREASNALRDATGNVPIFTLASALMDGETHVAGLPHAAYFPGDWGIVTEALGLRKVSPHNFFVLSADPMAETSAGGLYYQTRVLPHGRGVALPQLAVDFANIGGRGEEEAKFLLERYEEGLPFGGRDD